MLLGEKVNDFDVYMSNEKAAEAIAQYYVKKFTERNAKKIESMPKPYNPEVRKTTLTNVKGVEEERIVIWMKSAGVASEESEDDYYSVTDPRTFAETIINEAKEDTGEKYRPMFLSQNAITLSNKIQIIIRFYGSPEEIHDNYDFQHAKCWYNYKENKLSLDPEAMECLLSRTLIYRGSLYPIASLYRMRKFIERGWRISAGQITKIAWQISEIDLKNMDIVREQLTGVDQQYLYQLIQSLNSVEPEKIDSTYVATIIDKIFD